MHQKVEVSVILFRSRVAVFLLFYLYFLVKVNTTVLSDDDGSDTGNTDELAFLIDKAVDAFFDNHVLKFNALGRDISIPRNSKYLFILLLIVLVQSICSVS